MSMTKPSFRSGKTRKITVKGRNFYWFLAMDDNAPDVTCMRALNIISENRQFMVRYHLNQVDPHTRHITVLGPEFGGKQSLESEIRRYRAPGLSLTRRGLAGLISWCLSQKSKRIEVDITGYRVPVRSFWEKLLPEPTHGNNRSGNWKSALATASGLSGLFFS